MAGDGPLIAGAGLLVAFARWERTATHAMIPPELFRARGFVVGSGICLSSYAGFTGVLFYVTLLYQDVAGWSVLRTGLSWLLMNVPFLVLAGAAGRLDRRLPVAAVAAAGCLVAAAGGFVLGTVTIGTPFIVTAGGYVLFGAGFGALVPASTHAAMRDVPSAAAGAASGLFNAARQTGTSVGLAVLGAVGIQATVSDWTARAARFPDAERLLAPAQAPNVAGARIDAVAGSLGVAYRDAAAQSFLHGYHLAVLVGATCLLVAAAASTGLRHHPRGCL